MPEALLERVLLGWGALAVVLSSGLTLGAALVVWLKRAAPVAAPDELPAVTVIRPLKGLDPDAEACHRSLLEGRLRPARVLFVVESADDPAVGPVDAVRASDPERCRLVIAPPRPEVLSGKVRNMLAGWAQVETPLVAFCDSDIVLEPEHLARCVEALAADPQLAAASLPTLYDADSAVGRFSMLVMTVDCATLGRAMARLGVGGAAVGGLMVVRKQAVDALGGLELLGDALADDLRLGRALHTAGHPARLVDAVLVHRSGAESAGSHLLRHHRWLTSLRTETPGLFWGQLLLLLPTWVGLLVALALVMAGSAWAGVAWIALGAVAGWRVLQAAFVDLLLLRPHGVKLGGWCLLLPLADVLYGVVLLVTLLVPVVHWRGRWFRVRWWSGRILRELART